MILKKSIGSFIMVLITGAFLCAQDLYKVSPLGINTGAKELAPAFYMNGIVFCSDKRNDFLTSYIDFKNAPLTNLYFAPKKKDGRFESSSLFSKQLTTFMYEGPSCFSKDGNMIYFTRSIDVSSKSKNRLNADSTFGIFISRKTNGKWSNPAGFRFNSTAYNTGYPSVSDDGTRLFFCSDAPGGMGGLDIYVSTLRGGSWGDPENLGANVNTAKNDVFPFLQKDGRLYFASRGLNERGDLDIYYTVKSNGTWQKPIRLDSPFNSTSDDYGLIFNTSSDTAFFVSDRNGSSDIFGAYSTSPVFVNCPLQKKNDYCFVFYESNSNDLDTTAFAYEWNMGDGTKIRSIEAEHCFAQPGDYVVELNVIDKITKEVMLSQATYNFKVENIEQPYIIGPDTVSAGKPISFNGRDSYLKDMTIQNYYWDFGDGARLQGIEASHTYNFPGTYNITLGVTGQSNSSTEPATISHCVTQQIVVGNIQK